MKKMAIAATISLLCAAPAFAAPVGPYSVQEDVPETGSNITKRTVFWPIPVEKRYEELTSEERQFVRDDYVRLGARDEPPYPSNGMSPILAEVTRIQRTNRGPGLLHLAVRIDARGEPQGVAILNTPDLAIAHGVSYALMKTRYKPAMCDGAPCAGDYSFKYKVQVGYSHNFIADWNTNLWMVKMKGN